MVEIFPRQSRFPKRTGRLPRAIDSVRSYALDPRPMHRPPRVPERKSPAASHKHCGLQRSNGRRNPKSDPPSPAGSSLERADPLPSKRSKSGHRPARSSSKNRNAEPPRPPVQRSPDRCFELRTSHVLESQDRQWLPKAIAAPPNESFSGAQHDPQDSTGAKRHGSSDDDHPMRIGRPSHKESFLRCDLDVAARATVRSGLPSSTPRQRSDRSRVLPSRPRRHLRSPRAGRVLEFASLVRVPDDRRRELGSSAGAAREQVASSAGLSHRDHAEAKMSVRSQALVIREKRSSRDPGARRAFPSNSWIFYRDSSGQDLELLREDLGIVGRKLADTILTDISGRLSPDRRFPAHDREGLCE